MNNVHYRFIINKKKTLGGDEILSILHPKEDYSDGPLESDGGVKDHISKDNVEREYEDVNIVPDEDKPQTKRRQLLLLHIKEEKDVKMTSAKCKKLVC